MRKKEEQLRTYLQNLGSVAVAFSGGVDSTYLLKVAHDVLGDRAIAVTLVSDLFPGREREEAAEFCQKEGIHQELVSVRELEEIDGFAQNPPDRCYLCKRALFERIIELACHHNIAYVAEGSNMDDMGDYRPGLRAIAELGIVSPLREVKLFKKEIRELSKDWKLPTWDKQSFACLASRFAYGETITSQKLAMVEEAEQYLYEKGLRQFRVRIHEGGGEEAIMARIELLEEDMEHFCQKAARQELTDRFLQIGFTYIALDLQGYRTGSMNEAIKA